MTTHRARHGRGTKRPSFSERGAVLIEASISCLLLAVLTFGALEYGLIFGTTLDLATAARDGARAGSATQATGPVSDYDILQALKASTSAPSDAITRVVIYKANSVDGDPPAQCTEGTVVVGCNVYGPADFESSAATLAASPGGSGWPASSRVPGVDYIGVWINADHDAVSGLVKGPEKLTDRAVMRIEMVPPSASSMDSALWNNGTAEQPQWQTSWSSWGGATYGNRHVGSGGGSSCGGCGGDT